MSTLASPTLPARAATTGGLEAYPLRSERTIAFIRLAVIGVVTVVYVSSIGIRRSLGPGAVVILALAAVYATACLLVIAEDEEPAWRYRVASLLVDVGLITLWVQATGGPESEFWSLYLIAVVSTALRFGLLETVGIAVGLSVLHVSVTMGGLSASQLIYRPTIVVITGFAVGALAHQRMVQQRERLAVAEVAEVRGEELGQERAEVARLRRVDMARSEFVAVAAHEFRTPLAAIIGVFGTLRAHADVLDPEVRDELIEGASTQAERLARLVDDLLTVSRLDDGVLRLDMEPADPKDLVAEAAQASGAVGRVHVELHRVGRVICDPDAVIRVLTNLLDNALKYSPAGARIVLSVSQQDGAVRFAVRDGGAGVPPGDRDAVFERFRRLDGSGKRGAGLGLYISRGLVEAHGGTIAVGDAPEGGAEFAFTIPTRVLPLEPGVDVTDVTAAAGSTR